MEDCGKNKNLVYASLRDYAICAFETFKTSPSYIYSNRNARDIAQTSIPSFGIRNTFQPSINVFLLSIRIEEK